MPAAAEGENIAEADEKEALASFNMAYDALNPNRAPNLGLAGVLNEGEWLEIALNSEHDTQRVLPDLPDNLLSCCFPSFVAVEGPLRDSRVNLHGLEPRAKRFEIVITEFNDQHSIRCSLNKLIAKL